MNQLIDLLSKRELCSLDNAVELKMPIFGEECVKDWIGDAGMSLWVEAQEQGEVKVRIGGTYESRSFNKFRVKTPILHEKRKQGIVNVELTSEGGEMFALEIHKGMVTSIDMELRKNLGEAS